MSKKKVEKKKLSNKFDRLRTVAIEVNTVINVATDNYHKILAELQVKDDTQSVVMMIRRKMFTAATGFDVPKDKE